MLQATRNPQRVVIVGGGISGLSAAYYLRRDADVDVTVLEQASRWGGKVLTETLESDAPDGAPYVIEAGPDSFLTQKPWALQLARELGMEERLLGTNDAMRHVFVLVRGRPVRLPEGVLLIVPTKFMPFALSPLISPLGKLRMGLDLFIPAKRDGEDETLAQFIRRRLGNEALDKIAEPLMSGIYNAEAEQQSVMATFPRFRHIERDHGSLIKGMLASRRQRSAPKPAEPGQKPISTFMSFAGGTQDLTDTLVAHLASEADLRLSTGLERLTAHPEGGYTLQLTTGETLDADVVLFATPAYVTADKVRALAPEAAAQLDGIRTVSTGTISLAFDAADIPRPLQGFGLVIPGSEQRPINAVTISSTKFDQRAPEGRVLMRAFFGGSRSPQSMHLSDEELLHVVRGELRTILGIEATPRLHRIYRWWHANPQYDLGHLERVDAIEAALPEGVYVTGSPYRGVGMPDCVYQAQQSAATIAQALKERVD